MKNIKLTFRQDLQILRGIAILLVFLYHLKIDLFKNGFLGVDIFFVISGFLMAYRYKNIGVISFYKNRIKKLIPPFYSTILFVLFFSFFITITTDFNQFLKQFTASFFLYSNFYFWSLNSYFNLIDFKPLLHLWSLCLEFQFYIFFPLIILLNKKLLVILTISSFILSMIMCLVSPKTSFFLIPFRLWEFSFGILMAYKYMSRNDNKELSYLNTIYLLTAIIILVFLPININENNLVFFHPGVITLYPIIMTSIIIFWGMNKQLQHTIFMQFFSFLGKYSYLIYLVHFPIIVLYNYEPFSGTILKVETFYDLITIISLVVVFTWLINQIYEKKFNFKVFQLMIIVCLSSILFIKDFKNRKVSNKENLIFEAMEDRSTYRCGKKFRILNPFSHICNIGEEKNIKNILLVGDSFADSIKNSMSKTLNENGYNLLFYTANDPIIGKISEATILKDVKNRKIESIVFHYQPQVYNTDNFRKKFIFLLNKLQIPIFVILPVPEFNYNIPEHLYKLSQINKLSSSYSLDSKKKDERLLQFLKKKKNKVTILDPYEYLCLDKKKCFIFLDSKPLYFDSKHLTISGSKKLENLFKKIISDISNKNKIYYKKKL